MNWSDVLAVVCLFLPAWALWSKRQEPPEGIDKKFWRQSRRRFRRRS